MLAARGADNLRLLFAAKDGHYLASIATPIKDNRGTALLQAVAGGPFMFLKLTLGVYEISATYDVVMVSRRTNVPLKGAREEVFCWLDKAERE